jgi:hypothetical protein
MAETAIIRKMTVERFSGIEKFESAPAPGMNVILGGGHDGSEAVALLLNSSDAAVVSESDIGSAIAHRSFNFRLAR